MPLRPVEHLNTAMKLYPNIGQKVDDFRAAKGKQLPEWPDWCFLPMAAWYAIVADSNGTAQVPLNLMGDVAQLAAIGCWRYSQGIYRIDPDLLQALTDSPVSGRLPTDVLFRLPEWCVYIETPGCHWMGQPLHGFWAHLEWDANTGRTELRILLDCEDRLAPLVLHIGAWTITEAVDRMMSEARQQAQSRGFSLPNRPDDVQLTGAEINPLISLLLYLCSEEPEIDDARQPGTAPARPQPKKTKRGWRLFPPSKPRLWTVGATLGEALRQANTGEHTGRTVRPHLRRGHWHGYWTGPRRGDRRFVYRWISPLVVAGADEGA